MSSNQPTLYGQYRYAKNLSGAPGNLYASGYVPQTLSAALADLLSPSDTRLATVTAALADFLVIKEWIGVKQIRATLWVNPVVNANVVDTLYAKSTQGPVLYGGKNILYGGVKPTSTWTAGTSRQENWTQTNGHKYNA